jgi:hypothetical protein
VYEDPVQYANGFVGSFSTQVWPAGNFDVFAYTMSGTLNWQDNTSVPRFAPSGVMLRLAINTVGQVRVQDFLNGSLFVAPTVYQGVCSAGLITFIDQGTEWTISLGTYLIPGPRMPPQ